MKPQIVSISILGQNCRAFSYTLGPCAGLGSSGLLSRLGLAFGRRVLVDFKGRLAVGLCLGQTQEWEDGRDLKPVLSILDELPLWPLETLEWLRQVGAYYLQPFAEVVRSLLPASLKSVQRSKRLGMWVWAWEQQAGGEGQFIKRHLGIDGEMERISALPFDPASLLQGVGIHEADQGAPPPLHSAQAEVVCRFFSPLIEEFPAKPVLLFGGTGSGKTRVYLGVLDKLFDKGVGSALVLVPEIGLLAPMAAELKRLGVGCAIYHGSLSPIQKLQTWQGVHVGALPLVCGTRSALFLPYRNLKAIIVDEEHDPAYKESRGFRGQARDLACWFMHGRRGRTLLGSATPALETLWNVRKGKFWSLALPPGLAAGPGGGPRECVLDLRGRPNRLKIWPLELDRAVKHSLERGRDALLFVNRRGFAQRLFCPDCHWTARCEDCDRPYVWHQAQTRVRCPLCQFARHWEHPTCPTCSSELLGLGIGTERLEQILQERFPKVPIIRLDSDSVSDRTQLSLGLLSAGDLDQPRLWVGTQMLSKGFDFQNVGLAILFGADESFYSLDVKAEERFCQLYTQLRGRAGRRGFESELWIPTCFPNHPTLTRLREGGYMGAAQSMLAFRKEMDAFPYSRWIYFFSESASSNRAQEVLQDLATRLKAQPMAGALQLLGPMPSATPKFERRFRFALYVGGPQGTIQRWVRSQLKGWIGSQPAGRGPSRLRIWWDVDPLEG